MDTSSVTQYPSFGIFPWITQYTPVIPKLYWDVYSAEERMKWLSCEWDRIIHYLLDLCNQTNINTQDIAELKQEFEDFKTHGFDDYYREIIEQWVTDHFTQIVEKGLNIVYFGLTDDGYFCAYVPKEWAKYIEFTTGAIYGTDEYGRLILKY